MPVIVQRKSVRAPTKATYPRGGHQGLAGRFHYSLCSGWSSSFCASYRSISMAMPERVDSSVIGLDGIR